MSVRIRIAAAILAIGASVIIVGIGSGMQFTSRFCTYRPITGSKIGWSLGFELRIPGITSLTLDKSVIY
jgi:hypothetical protein